MHLHILGICGTFMGGIAALAKEAGHTVSGMDAGVYPPMSTQLESLGIALTQGFDPADIPDNVDVFVVGNAISRGNPALEYVLNRGFAYTSGPQWLAENVLQGRWVLAVAGTHGKTTTASILAWILEHAGMQPGFLIGGVPENFGVSARLGGSDFFVIEADEYDTAFCDKRSKFVHYRPRTLVLNNLEFDHADIFADLAAIQRQFHHVVRIVPEQGRLLVNASAPALDEVLEMGCWSEVEKFDQDGDSVWNATAVTADCGQFKLTLNGEPAGQANWPLIGRHNMLNAVAAVAAARHVGILPQQALEGLAEFHSVKRRLEVRGTEDGVTVYDDFAHHPTAITETLGALRAKVGSDKIIAILEPRSNTMKMGVHDGKLAASLVNADEAHVYCAEADDAPGLKAALNTAATLHDKLPALINTAIAAAQPGDHILVMSNGGFGGIHSTLLERLAAR